MIYKKGDTVKIKSFKWYNENKDKKGDIDCGEWFFNKDQVKYCGVEAKIIEVYRNFYKLDIDRDEWCWTDEMFEKSIYKNIHFKNGDIKVVSQEIAETILKSCAEDFGSHVIHDSDGNLILMINLKEIVYID